MRSVALALSAATSTIFSSLHFKKPLSSISRVSTQQTREPCESGVCRGSQVSPEIVIREARLEDCWGVAETHCTTFFPRYRFPFNFLLRINRLLPIVFGFSLPSGCTRTCLVATSTSLFGNGYVAGILTVDTLADFLPRKGPLRQRRSGIAYISNVAVRDKFRRKGIAKRLVHEAEAQARTWGCHAIALHCDLNNLEATKLYIGQGFKCIRVPQGANWPRPKASPDVNFNFMMKLLN